MKGDHNVFNIDRIISFHDSFLLYGHLQFIDHKMEDAEYEEYMHRNITIDYKKAGQDDFEKVTKGDTALASNLEIDDSKYITSKREAFLTLKDHKPNYIKNLTFRLINPIK